MEDFILGYDYSVWYEYGAEQEIRLPLRTHPSLLLTGASGSGKSYALKFLLGQIAVDAVSMTFCNFKDSDDFKFLKNYEDYYVFRNCGEGLLKFYEGFQSAQNADTEFPGTFHILIFDEFPAFILSASMQDKKLAEKYKAVISGLLMLGRAYGFGVWLVMQRPDSSFLSNGARDNFHTAISLGNISKEARKMLYSGEELPERIYRAGEGVCWMDGTGMCEIKFPKIADMPALEKRISHRLCRMRPQGKQEAGPGEIPFT